MLFRSKKKDLVDNRGRHADGIKIEFEQAKQDLVGQNPDADIAAFSKDLRLALADLEDEYQDAMKAAGDIKQSIRVKRSTLRAIDVRMEIDHKQVLHQMIQFRKLPEQKSA